MNEYIYILSNPSMPGLIVVGKTTAPPPQRMAELYSTGVPTPFELEFSALVSNCEYSENAAHRTLASYRVTGDREFFRVSTEKAIDLILPALGDYKIQYMKRTHGIDESRREADRRGQERKDADRARQVARQQEADRREAKELAKLRAIEQRILAVEQKIPAAEQELRQLGPRPVKKELPAIGQLLFLCYWPWPLGWIVWLGALTVFQTKYQTIGLVCILVIIAGYIFYRIEEKNQDAFNEVDAPFFLPDLVLSSLRRELSILKQERELLKLKLGRLP